MNIEEIEFVRSYLARRPNAEPYDVVLAWKRYVRNLNNDPLTQPLTVRYLGRLVPKALRRLAANAATADDDLDSIGMRSRLNAAFQTDKWRIVWPWRA